MPTKIPTRLRLTPEDKEAMRVFWEFYEPLADEISMELRASLRELPEWAPILRSLWPDGLEQMERSSRARQRAAILDGEWAPYLEELRQQGLAYAQQGVSFVAWYDVIAIYRELIRRRLLDLIRTDVERATLVANGMTRFVDLAMSHLGEAYLAAKESIIAQQQLAIRELSLPILQVRDRLLVVPLVGVVDSTRARLLIESLLAAIRDKRARGVVIDVTGVPIVDTGVAHHLVQACEAAKLMGATVVITGISPEMAQTLVGLGAKLPAAETLGDLQEGIAFIESQLRASDEAAASSDAPEHGDQLA